MELFIALVALTALVTALFSLMLALGTALRYRGSSSRARLGLAPGTALAPDALYRFWDVMLVDEWLQGDVLIVLVSSACAPCHDLVRTLNEPLIETSGLGVGVIETRPSGTESLRSQASFPAAWANDADGEAGKIFQTDATPHSFLIRRGQVVDHAIGSDISRLLRQTAMANPAAASSSVAN